MDKRVEIRCTADELGVWKAAAGEVALSRWLRLAAMAYATACSPPEIFRPVPDRVSFCGGLVRDVPSVPFPGKPEFRPDFGSRLKGGGDAA
jgi:hypothetical protein